MTCTICGEQVTSFKCNLCGNFYCIDHHLNHTCSNVGKEKVKEQPNISYIPHIERKKSKTSNSKINSRSSNIGHSSENGIFGLIGFLLMIIGILLFIGNLSGASPSFPFAGFITMSIGWLFVKGAFK